LCCAMFSHLFSLSVEKKTLFMWPILYFLILFISYCCVHKKEHGVDHRGKFYVKRAFILLENSKFGNFYTIVKTLYFRLKNSTFFIFVSFFKLKKMKRDC
uniref:Uncharacterized protein n=1 Tax=Haplochromis burtoni TaxID=8153 RepID=A0A3Q2WJU2_HAPBU